MHDIQLLKIEIVAHACTLHDHKVEARELCVGGEP